MPGLLEAMDAAVSSVEKGEDFASLSKTPSLPPPAPPPATSPREDSGQSPPHREVESKPIDYREVQQWLLQLPLDEDALAQMREDEVRGTSCCMGRRRCATDAPGLDRSLWRDKDFVLSLSATKYSPAEDVHIRMLRTAYHELIRSPPCPDVGPHWEALGFQGVDPRSDLNRSGGLLNVVQFFYFFSHYSETARVAAELARDPRQSFPLACVSINVTDIVTRSLLAGRLSKLCNSARHGVLESSCRIHAGAMCHFVSRWRSLARTIRDTEAALNEVRQLVAKSPARLLEALQSAR